MDIKKKINVGLEWMISIPYQLIKKVKKDSVDFFMSEACRTAENEKYQLTYRKIPKNVDEVNCLSYPTDTLYAIVMQGPIRMEENFTLKTIEYYKKVFPQAYIIVSTWNDEAEDVINEIKKTGAYVVLNSKPNCTGTLMVNYQLVNSFGGIKKAAELGAEYVAKTRTDQRINRLHFLDYCRALIQQFSNSVDNSKEYGRIVALSMTYGNLFYPYLISDFFYFGKTADMLRLFSVPLDNRERYVKIQKNATRREFSKLMIAPEVYIMKNYFQMLGCVCDDTIEDYWRGVKNNLICLSMRDLDIIWPKYEDRYRLHHYWGDYFESNSENTLKNENFDFINWLDLYSGILQYDPEYEKFADVIFK